MKDIDEEPPSGSRLAAEAVGLPLFAILATLPVVFVFDVVGHTDPAREIGLILTFHGVFAATFLVFAYPNRVLNRE
jgi:hypothetical protein